MKKLLIGVDFDNTLVSYDRIFESEARHRGYIKDGPRMSKGEIRNYMNDNGMKTEFTQLQGHIYGSLIHGAQAFEQALEALTEASSRGHEVILVSHKTQYPLAGPPTDLRKAAMSWLEYKGFASRSHGVIKSYFFADTKEEKIEKIINLGCDVFVDDLDDIIIELSRHLKAVHFTPSRIYKSKNWRVMSKWSSFGKILGEIEGGL